MGLLDFFSKSGSTAPTDGTTVPQVPDFAGIQQSYTNQSLANVSYPMANSNPYGAANPVPPPSNLQTPVTNAASPVENNLQSMQMPQIQPNMAVSPGSVSAPEVVEQPQMNSMNVESTEPSQDNAELPPYEYVDPSKHPVIPAVVPNKGHIETMPEGIKVTTFEGEDKKAEVEPEASSEEPTPEVNTNEVSLEPNNQNQQNVDNQFQNPTQSQELTTGFMPIQNPLDSNSNSFNSNFTAEPNNPIDGSVANTLESSSLPVDNMQSSTMDSTVPVTPEGTSELNTPEIVPGMDTTPGMEANPSLVGVEPVEPQPPVEPEPEVDTTNVGLEIGVGEEGANVNDVESSNETIEEVNTVEVGTPEELSQAMPPALEPEISTDISMPESEVDAPGEEILEEVPEVKPTNDLILPDTVISTPEIEETPKESSVESTVAPIANFEMSYFKTVGFIGLNTPQPNSKVVEKINDLASKLAEHAEVFILDSAKGYAKSIFDNGKQKQIELMGMFLKPFHSEYSDEGDLGDYEDFTVMMFSNSADKIKNIIKESDILIMPEVTGLNNMSTLFDIWSTNSLYAGQHKPLLLIGKGWTNILSQLKSLFRLSESDLSFVTVCQTTEEALNKIAELDNAFINKEIKQPRRVIDLREEDDEEGLFV